QSRHVAWRRWRRCAQNVLQDPLAANHGRGARRIRRDREDACLAEQTATMAVWVERDLAELAAEDVWNAIVPREPLVEIRVVGLDQIEHALVLANDARQQQLSLLPHRLAQVVVKILEQAHVGNERIQIAEMQPLPAEIGDERPRSLIGKHPPHLLLEDFW